MRHPSRARASTSRSRGMTCAACANRIERKLNKLEGVDASVNYATEQAAVRFDPERVTVADLLGAVESAGYHAVPAAEARVASDRADAVRRRLVVAAALTAPLVVLAMVMPLQFEGWEWLALALATPVVFWAGFDFHRAAALNARHGAATMDTLISIGTLAAWGWSVAALVVVDDADVYFEVAAVITTLILLGRYLEARARRRSGAAIRALLELGAKEARRLAGRGGGVRSDRRARRRRPLRRPSGREGRDGRSRGRGRVGGRPVDADGRARSRSTSHPAPRWPARPSTRSAGSSCVQRASARRRPSRRSRGSWPRPSPGRRRSSASSIGSRASSSRSCSCSPSRPSSAGS